MTMQIVPTYEFTTYLRLILIESNGTPQLSTQVRTDITLIGYFCGLLLWFLGGVTCSYTKQTKSDYLLFFSFMPTPHPRHKTGIIINSKLFTIFETNESILFVALQLHHPEVQLESFTLLILMMIMMMILILDTGYKIRLKYEHVTKLISLTRDKAEIRHADN